MSEHPLDWAPCGPCGALVPRATGCIHWRPVKALASALRARATRERISREKKKPGPWSRAQRAKGEQP